MKKIFISAAVVAASVFGFYTANQNNAKANLSDLQLENVEALGQEEPIGSYTDCRSVCRFSELYYCDIRKSSYLGYSYYHCPDSYPN